jgi:hypothetical protein
MAGDASLNRLRYTFAFVVVAGAIAIGVLAALVDSQSNSLEKKINRTEKIIKTQRVAIRLLCERGFVLDDVIVGLITVYELKLKFDTPHPKLVQQDKAFIGKLAADRARIISQLPESKSPCTIQHG